MSRRKRASKVLEKAERRASSLKSISTTLNLNNGLTLDKFSVMIDDVRSKVSDYNAVLSKVDQSYNDMMAAEQTLSDLSELMLLGVASKYGKNSNEYEMAGGVRKSDRKRSTRSVVPISTSTSSQSVAS
jgi:uncharacterized protein YoxC